MKKKVNNAPNPAHEGKGFLALAGEAFVVLGEEIVEGKDKIVEVAAEKFTAVRKAINKITHKKSAKKAAPPKKAAPVKKAAPAAKKKGPAKKAPSKKPLAKKTPVKKAAKPAAPKKAVPKRAVAPKKVAKKAVPAKKKR